MQPNPKRDAEICRLKRELGMSVPELAKRFKLSGARVHQILSRGGLGKKMPEKLKTPNGEPQIDRAAVEHQQRVTKKRRELLAEKAALARWEKSNKFLSDPLWLEVNRRNMT